MTDIVDGGLIPPPVKKSSNNGRTLMLQCPVHDESVLQNPVIRTIWFTKLLTVEQERKYRDALAIGVTCFTVSGMNMVVANFIYDMEPPKDGPAHDVIVLTNKSEPKLKEKLLAAGWDIHSSKDYNINEVLHPDNALSWQDIWHQIIELYRYNPKPLIKMFKDKFPDNTVSLEKMGLESFLIGSKEIDKINESVAARRKVDRAVRKAKAKKLTK
jgi:hypothetical protein